MKTKPTSKTCWHAEPPDAVTLTRDGDGFAFAAKTGAELTFPGGRELWRSADGHYGRPGEVWRCRIEAGQTLRFQ